MLEGNPADVSAHHLLASVYLRLNRHEEAERQLLQTIDLAPDHAKARWMLAYMYVQRAEWKKGLREIESLLQRDPDDSDYLNLKAESLLNIGEYDGALACYERLVSKHPTAENWMYYGHALRARGRNEDCIAAYRNAIAQNPEFGEAYWSLANLKTFKFTQSDIEEMHERLQKANLAPRGRAALHFALGKAFEDSKQYAPSFEQYQRGNAAWRKQLPYNADAVTAFVRRSKAVFTPEFFAGRPGRDSPASDPIFVVSVPRSGSTLVEQILASHSAVEGTRELPILTSLAEHLTKQAGGSQYPESVRRLGATELNWAGEEYLRRASVHRKLQRPFFVDKMTGNFLHLGLLHLILPNAKIIDVRRHPLACGFANFRHFYLQGAAFAFDLAEIGRYYRDYVELMAHFDAVLPGRVHRIFYEELVANPEREIRKLLAHCGLPFEEACLRFYETERGVFTPSAAQVRQPIFTDALEQWRNYEKWLEPLKAALGDVLACYPAAPTFGERAPAAGMQQQTSQQGTVLTASGAPALRQSGQVGTARRPFAEARQRLFPPLEDPTLEQAAGALAGNRADFAQQLLSKFLERHPNDPRALNLMADVARRADNLSEAERLLSACVAQAPGSCGYRFNYAVILRRLEKFENASTQMEELLRVDPANPLFREQKAKILHDLGRHAEALTCRESLKTEYPEAPEIWLGYGDSLLLAGYPDRAVSAYRKTLEIAPRLRTVYPRLANLRGYRFTAADTEWLERNLAGPSLSEGDRANLHFALGNAYGDQGLYEKSFTHYARGNGLRRTNVDADPDRFTAFRLTCQSLFTETFFHERAGWGCASRAPIFIVGMPRSGSTLIEQILSAHSRIEGLGEIPDLIAAADRLFDNVEAEDPALAFAQAIGNLTAAGTQSLAEAYLEGTAQRRKLARPFFTDKSLSNFTLIGVIHAILPNAKIIDIRRHPLDCGWSCFKTHFPDGQPFSHDLSDIGRHYADYVRLMAHFDRVLPGRVHRILYEELVANPETELRRLFDYLGLPFEEQCLRFHENRRPVRTLSVEQVRMPLYKSGMGQWRPYEAWLGPLKAALGPVLEAYPKAPQPG